MIELCRIIWNFDEFRRKEELSSELRETAEWAVSVGKSLADGKTLPSGFPVPPWAPRPEPTIYAGNTPDVVLRESVLEGNLV
ncbi:MAG: hypothetical protein DRP71_08255 [Verrucomicrobia bacterium]|nr:MAG: hypothetical protein DRP71_08255 [Verrucomicrobiota bacterium]